MPKLTWSAFIDQYPAAHLVVGIVPDEEPTGSLRRHLDLMAKLTGRLAKGHYALTINRQGQMPGIQCSLEREDDANRIGDALAAEPQSGDHPGWASQRMFQMDADKCQAITDTLETV